MNNLVRPILTSTSTSTIGIFLEQGNSPVTATGSPLIGGSVGVDRRKKPRSLTQAVDIEGAVYSYIQAVRALGKTKLTTNEIAASLSISPSDVNEAIAKLHSKGVKIISR